MDTLHIEDTPEHIGERMAEPTLTPKQLGALGEDYVAAALESRGWVLLSRNWRTRFGEIDVVMLDDERAVAFIEVKTRRSTRFGTPQEAVTRDKQMNLRKAAIEWLSDPEHRIAHHGIRFDVASVMAPVGSLPRVFYIRAAF